MLMWATQRITPHPPLLGTRAVGPASHRPGIMALQPRCHQHPGVIACLRLDDREGGVPVSDASIPCPPGSQRYTVQPGDTLFFIAQRFGTTVDAILAINPQIANPNLIFPGQVICIPRGGTA
ncbi:MAG: LysM peptidoglycan-binding domain-containing protein [Firmicutes bacterium]|nr:LysM peptidoglycan-binding domain-containing protein [Bacillota bacterium]